MHKNTCYKEHRMSMFSCFQVTSSTTKTRSRCKKKKLLEGRGYLKLGQDPYSFKEKNSTLVSKITLKERYCFLHIQMRH